jgi:hypothetical protein
MCLCAGGKLMIVELFMEQPLTWENMVYFADALLKE